MRYVKWNSANSNNVEYRLSFFRSALVRMGGQLQNRQGENLKSLAAQGFESAVKQLKQLLNYLIWFWFLIVFLKVIALKLLKFLKKIWLSCSWQKKQNFKSYLFFIGFRVEKKINFWKVCFFQNFNFGWKKIQCSNYWFFFQWITGF